MIDGLTERLRAAAQRREGNTRRGRLITVSGIDCSGKTTQLDLTEMALGRAGETVVRFWLRPGYSPELTRLRTALRRFAPKALPTTNAPAARERQFSRPYIKRTWVAVAMLDMALQYGGKLSHLLSTGRTVLCDRYVFDAFLDLELRFPDLRPNTSPLATLVKGVAPTPDHAFLLSLPRSEMLRRMAIKREPFPDSDAIRDVRYDAYERAVVEHRFTVIDASQPLEEVHKTMMATLLPVH